MGIYDRDYSRASHAPRTPSGFRAGGRNPLSVTGWIIAACVVVYVFNVFGPKVPTLVSTTLLQSVSPAEIAGIRASDFAVSPIQWEKNRPRGQMIGRAVVQLGGRPVAIQEFRLDPLLMHWGYFSTAKAVIWHDTITGWSGLQVWRFISFQFLHSDVSIDHILFNMLTLFFFGGMVEQYLGRKRYLAFYLLCGICGALMYLLLNGLGVGGQALFGPRFNVPGLLVNDPTLPLVGASAGVFGVIMAGAFLAPNAQVMLFFIIPMRLKTLAYGLVCVALVAVFFGWTNAGGEAAHIGGALAGFYFIRNPHHLHGMFDFLGQFDPTSRVAKARAAQKRSGVQGTEIDRILSKIRQGGLNSLTEAEKGTLREASRR